jgi:hypothetical protein
MTSEFFPKFSRQKRVGEAGVNAVSTIVNDDLKWIFRRVNLEHDFGIDGYIDFVQDDGAVTGQSFAAQIKTGKSFLSTKTPAGFTYYGEKKHLNYYLNLPVPLLIVLCDDEVNQCYWEKFDIRKTEPTPTGWKLTIPKSNILSRDSKDQLVSIIGPAPEHTEAVKAHWGINQNLNEFDFVFYVVDREDIEDEDIKNAQDFIERIYFNDSLCRKFQGRIEIFISGYDDDPRELFEIPEVVRWYQKADPILKHWFFFANTVAPASGLNCYWACLCGAKRTPAKSKSVGTIQVELERESLVETLKLNFSRLNELTTRLGITDEENKKISFAVCKAIQLPGAPP